MKIKFDPNMPFQRRAIDSITGVFEGQEVLQTNFTVAPLQYAQQMRVHRMENNLGIGNHIKLLDEEIHANIRKIQLNNGLPPSKAFRPKDGIHLTVEMETGTGKTYVYLRTIFELNRLYGFTKFIIVVPSIAIKEGVYKTLEITATHFKDIYENISFDYFVYNNSRKGNLSNVRSFATNSNIQIMVINIDAFRKSFANTQQENKANIIHRHHDRMGGAKPIEFIQETNPIVIIDEPQSVDTTDKSKEAIKSLNPLCTLRYSATHVEQHHMLYRLDAVDAYEQKLVKQIEVAGIAIKDVHNTAYIKLLSVDNKNSPITARIEIECRTKKGRIKRKTIRVAKGADLMAAESSGGREIYNGYIIEDIECKPDHEYISFTSKPESLTLGQAIGEINPDEYKRLQIRKTIEEHLDKELRLHRFGIKVLSLFFIDKVANYRTYDAGGNPQKGKFARMFEEEYTSAIRQTKYSDLFKGVDLDTAAEGVHNGYFAVDNKKDSAGRVRLKDTSGNSAADESAYNLIMKDKERLLSFASRLKFIFSHSALREGWDNPNVFQICTLNETNSVIKKRQEIGRGLRICVNQQGERMHGFDINTLTVMANESYESFAAQLQKEIEHEEGIKFGVIEEHQFANIIVATENEQDEYLGVDASRRVWNCLRIDGFIDEHGKAQSSLKAALAMGTLELPLEFEDYATEIKRTLKKITRNLNIKNRDDQKVFATNKEAFLSPDFKKLWDQIKHKTTFRVDFDAEKLITACTNEIATNLTVGKAKHIYRKARISIDRGGVQAGSPEVHIADIDNSQTAVLPDLITYLQNETNLTRRTIVRIIKDSGTLDSFKNNPQKFIDEVTTIIQKQKQLFIVDGIKYQKIGNDAFYAQELFERNELFGYLQKTMGESHESIFDHAIYDSHIDRDFAQALEHNKAVRTYVKLPGWFKINTPLGDYNPDWAIVIVEEEGQSKLYFVMQ